MFHVFRYDSKSLKKTLKLELIIICCGMFCYLYHRYLEKVFKGE